MFLISYMPLGFVLGHYSATLTLTAHLNESDCVDGVYCYADLLFLFE